MSPSRPSNEPIIEIVSAVKASEDIEVESAAVALRTVAEDPLLLTSMKIEPQVLHDLERNGSKKLLNFYRTQNRLIDTLLTKPDHRDENEEEQLLKLKMAIYGSLCANILLFGLQLVGAILSRSLSLFATTADAFMDVASNLVLVFASRLASSENQLMYPTGKARYETAGTIVFACLMSTLSVQLIVESIQSLISRSDDLNIGTVSLVCIGVAIGFKVMLYFFCKALSKYATARILAQDHQNDLLLNLTGVALSLMGQHIAWWLDPAGGIIIALLILKTWASTAREHITLIVGKTADPDFLTRLTYIAMTHDDRILQIDTCRAYHSGNRFVVEVDIVLPPEMPLCEAHDIGEELQVKLETLEDVERAFVHLDYETSHKPEHQKVL